MKVLAVKWRRLGDTVLWTSALQALSDMPGTVLDIAFEEAYADLFESDPRIRKKFLLGKDNRSLLKQLQEEDYAFVLNFHASHRSYGFCNRVKGQETLVHHHSRNKKTFFSSRPIPNLGIPMKATERDLNVVRALGWNGTAPQTRLFVDPKAVTDAGEFLREKNLFKKPLILFGVRASRPAKEWGLEKYAQLAEALSPEYQIGVLVESLSALPDHGPHIRSLQRSGVILVTRRLRDLMGVLTYAACYVGSDSGVKHTACALGIKTVTLFGPESLGEWHCYAAPHRAIQIPVKCRDKNPEQPEFSWCGEALCPLSSHACMNLISPEEVLAQIRSCL